MPRVFRFVFLAVAASAANAAPFFQGLGGLAPPNSAGYQSQAEGVSLDGQVVVGQSWSAQGMQAFRWTADGGMQGLGDFPTGDSASRAYATNEDGSVVVGSGTVGIASFLDGFRWTQPTGLEPIGYLDSPGLKFSYALDVSGDGSIVVGASRSALGNEAFRWTAAGGIQGLGALSNGKVTQQAAGVSAEGDAIAGIAGSGTSAEPFRWTAAEGAVGLGLFPGGTRGGRAWAISPDGGTIVGYAHSASGFKGFRWTAANGMQDLGLVPGEPTRLDPFAVSADGAIIAGTILNVSDPLVFGGEAFIWDQVNGARFLKDVLADFGVDLGGWTLRSVTGISADGTVVVGVGRNPQGKVEAFVARIPEASSVLLATVGLLALSAVRRKRAAAN